MPITTRLEHQTTKIFHCLSLIEKVECNDKTGEICTILQLNQLDTILDMIYLDDENMKEMYKMKSNKRQRIHFTMIQRNSLKFIQYYNNAKPMVLFHWSNGY